MRLTAIVVLISFALLGCSSSEVSCGKGFSEEAFVKYVNSNALNGVDVGNVERLISSCKNDKFLSSLLFVLYLKERKCTKSADVFQEMSGNGFRLGSSMEEEVAFCFYDMEDYVSAIKYFSLSPSIRGAHGSLWSAYAYAESLYADNQLDKALKLLLEVSERGEGNGGGSEQGAYYLSLVTLSRILYVKHDYEESIRYASRAIKIDAVPTDAYEVLLASALEVDKLDGRVMRGAYCAGEYLRAHMRGRDEDEVYSDLRRLDEQLVGVDANHVDCSTAFDSVSSR